MSHDQWWPPKVGDKLRHATLHYCDEPAPRKVDALVHVVAVFEHAGATLATVAEWFPSRRRWHYETIGLAHASGLAYWPDGTAAPTIERPRREAT
jgi:hypothetical protein